MRRHEWRVWIAGRGVEVRRCRSCGLWCRVRFCLFAGRRVEQGARRYAHPDYPGVTAFAGGCGALPPANASAPAAARKPAGVRPESHSPRVRHQAAFRRFWRPRLKLAGLTWSDYERVGRQGKKLYRAVALMLWTAHCTLAAIPETRHFSVRSQLDPARAYLVSRSRRRPAAE